MLTIAFSMMMGSAGVESSRPIWRESSAASSPGRGWLSGPRTGAEAILSTTSIPSMTCPKIE